MKINPIMAVLAFIFGLGGALVAYSWTGLSAELMTNGSISLVSSILGLIGIYLYEKDYKIAIAQYVLCGAGVLIGTSLYGVLGCVFFVLAAILAYVEKDKSGAKAGRFDEVHFYGDERQIRERYADFPHKASKNSIFWAVPVISVILIISVGVLGGLSYQHDLHEKANGIEIINISSDLNVQYGYYSGGVKGILTSQNDINSVQIKGVWYAQDGSQIDQTYDTNILNDIKAGQKYQLNIPYYQSSDKKPVKVVIEVYESFDKKPLFNQTVQFS